MTGLLQASARGRLIYAELDGEGTKFPAILESWNGHEPARRTPDQRALETSKAYME
jgi:hypothetical protein